MKIDQEAIVDLGHRESAGTLQSVGSKGSSTRRACLFAGALLLACASHPAAQSASLPRSPAGTAAAVPAEMDGVADAVESKWLESRAIAALRPWTLPAVIAVPLPLGRSGRSPLLREPRSVYEATASFEMGEMHAIQRHLGFVLERLAERDVSALPAALREQRLLQIERLSTYRDRAVFPRNGFVPDLSPVFIDADGRACAVAYLMIEAGARDLAERVAGQENLAYLPEIATPGVARWIEESGLDAEECALIQPNYWYYSPWSLQAGVNLDFFARSRQGQLPLVVRFRGLWTNMDPLQATWSWDFGDGATSSLQNPTHTYTAPGIYTVSLTSTTLFPHHSATETKVGFIVVQP